MIRFFRCRKLGPTDLTWEEKNSANYLFDAKNTRKSQDLSDKNGSQKKGREKPNNPQRT